jgi:hypothetical protein
MVMANLSSAVWSRVNSFSDAARTQISSRESKMMRDRRSCVNVAHWVIFFVVGTVPVRIFSQEFFDNVPKI